VFNTVSPWDAHIIFKSVIYAMYLQHRVYHDECRRGLATSSRRWGQILAGLDDVCWMTNFDIRANVPEAHRAAQ
jgi:hypothetical protein